MRIFLITKNYVITKMLCKKGGGVKHFLAFAKPKLPNQVMEMYSLKISLCSVIPVHA